MPQRLFPIFCCFCVSEKLHKKYSRNWTKQKPKFLFFLTRDGVQSRDGGEPGASHTMGWRGPAPGRTTRWWGHLAHLYATLPPIYSPRRENPKTRSIFHETNYKPPPLSTRDQEGPEALLGTLPERGITTGGLLHHHACLRSDVWVVYLRLWVHSSS
jgi:hypothetical protein